MKVNKGKFKTSCPNCHEKDKVVLRCRKCYKFTCSRCSVDKRCMDCFMEVKTKDELRRYFDEKYVFKEAEVAMT